MKYRPVGSEGAYPAWLRELRGKSGVYLIKEGRTLVYVGESHTGRLYQTITRHFQGWRRKKSWWEGLFTSGHDPGLTYDRAACSVAVEVMAPSEAVEAECEWIAAHVPRDNLLCAARSKAEDVPF